MKTWVFIGSQKNAGKTTFLRKIYRNLLTQENPRDLLLTSVGINGESTDALEGFWKPPILVAKNSFCVTHSRWVMSQSGTWKVHRLWTARDLKEQYVLLESLVDQNVILEGPNEGETLLKIKEELKMTHPHLKYLLIDGSVDREFIAHPQIADGFFLSLVWPHPRSQLLLKILSLPLANEKDRQLIDNCSLVEGKSSKPFKALIFDQQSHRLEHISYEPLWWNSHLLSYYSGSDKKLIYLKSAWTQDLYLRLRPYRQISLVLDNFTYFLADEIPDDLSFFLLHPVHLEQISRRTISS